MVNNLLLEIAYLRHQEMLRQAEAERRYRQLKGNRPSLLKQVSHRLLATGWQLKAHRQSNTDWVSIN